MKITPKWYRIILLFYIIYLTLSCTFCFIRDSSLPKKEYAKPTIITKPVYLYESPISQIVDDGMYIYALADRHDGYIQVYDYNGNYQCTISFYSSSISGAFSMTVVSDILYVKDCSENIYLFKGGIFQEFIQNSNLTEDLEQILETDYSGHFKLHYGSIWRYDTKEATCVVSRPALAIFYQYGLDTVLLIIILLLTGIVSMKYRHPKS